MIGPNTIVFFIPFSVPLHEIKFTVDGLKNWLNQKKIKEVPYLCDSVTQQWMFWVHREKKSNILFLKLSVLILMVRWVFEFPVVSIISKENFLKFWMFGFFFLSPMSLFRQPSCLLCEGILIWLCLLTMRRDKLHLDFQTPETQSPE